MTLFPMFLKLEGRSTLVVGAGAIATPKIESLLQAGARVRVVAPQASETVARWAQEGRMELVAKSFDSADLNDVFLVIVATSSREVNANVFEEARSRKILCNVVDDPEHCDFYYPSVVRRGKLQLAISTEGQSPALAQKLRLELEEQYGPEYEQWVEQLGAERAKLFQSDIDPEVRRRRLHELAAGKPTAPEVKDAR
ncbi:MAG TPA: bifunctional precorrin-2 dehydrogenase/sirohydrochlorin ferrochelatase [Terriglobales bacterium]